MIRVFFISSLIFSFWLSACDTTPEKEAAISIEWKEGRAMGIVVPMQLLQNVPKDSIEQWLTMHLAIGDAHPAMLGEYVVTKDSVVFHPLIPLTPAMKYEVQLKGELIGQANIPVADPGNAPAIIAIYPSGDTVPENLLKIYIVFSKPMQDGIALQHIQLLKDGHDTLPAVFLNLQPELWNNEQTMLTLWLDPGRIKRDLQPNKEMGPPLVAGTHYELLIKKGWPDTYGAVLAEDYHKEFVTAVRDSSSPDPLKWTLGIPKAGADEPLNIDLHESLDYALLKNAITVVDEKGKAIEGTLHVNPKETSIYFSPANAWKVGNYILQIESRLEDNAGNNLNHLFDNDLTQKQKSPKDIFKLRFIVNQAM